MQRVVVVIACVAVGAVAIYGAVQTLSTVPDIGAAEGAAQSEEGPLRTVVVRMHDTKFKPRVASVRGGVGVEWSNDDDVAHTVEKIGQEGEDFGSDRIEPGDTYSYTFVEQGVYRYRCSIHPNRMSGQVSVLGD